MGQLGLGDLISARVHSQQIVQPISLDRLETGEATLRVGDRTFGKGQKISSLDHMSPDQRNLLLDKLFSESNTSSDAAKAWQDLKPSLLQPDRRNDVGGGRSASELPSSSSPSGHSPENQIYMLKSCAESPSSPSKTPASKWSQPPASPTPTNNDYGTVVVQAQSRWEKGGNPLLRPLSNITGSVVQQVGEGVTYVDDAIQSNRNSAYTEIPDRDSSLPREPEKPYGRSTDMTERTMLTSPESDRTRTREALNFSKQKFAETLGGVEGGAAAAAEFGVSTGVGALVSLAENKVPVVGAVSSLVKHARLDVVSKSIGELAERAEGAFKDTLRIGSTPSDSMRLTAAALRELNNVPIDLLKRDLKVQGVASLVPLPGTAFVVGKAHSKLSGIDEKLKTPLNELRRQADGGNPYAIEFFEKILDMSSAQVSGDAGLTNAVNRLTSH